MSLAIGTIQFRLTRPRRSLFFRMIPFMIFSGVGLAAQPWAQASTEPNSVSRLALEEVLTAVRSKFPLIEAARQDFRAAEGELLSSRGAFDLQLKGRSSWDLQSAYLGRTLDAVLEQPTPVWGLSLLGGYRYGRGSFPVYDGKLKTLPDGELRGGVLMPLLRDGPTDSRRVRIERARIGVDVAEASWHQQLIDAVRLARQRYYEWVAAGAKVQIAKRLLEIAEKRDLQLQEQHRRGDASRFDENDNRRGLLQRRAQFASAERLLQRSELELSVFIRDVGGQPVVVDRARLPETLPELPQTAPPEAGAFDLLIEEARQARPDLKRLQGQIDQNEREIRLARNQLLPRVDLNVAVSKDLGTGAAEYSSTETEAALTLEFPLPLRTARGRLESANATESRLLAQAQLARDRVGVELRDARSALMQARERVRLAIEENELALTLEKGERARFAHGDSNLIFVQLREQTTADAATRKIDALLDYWLAEASWEAAQGLPRP
ncbi:MAG: hypothetical protein RJB38_2402 [Pseudomonadota bacterium]|jgi:outer membrane protein TolC